MFGPEFERHVTRMMAVLLAAVLAVGMACGGVLTALAFWFWG